MTEQSLVRESVLAGIVAERANQALEMNRHIKALEQSNLGLQETVKQLEAEIALLKSEAVPTSPEDQG